VKILVLALSGIGDALLFTPALKLMRQALPHAQIDALVMFAGVKEMYERNPNFDSVFYFDFMREHITASFRFIIGLRKKYDASISVYPSNRKEYNILNFLVGAKTRAGVQYLRLDRRNFGFLNNVRIRESDSLHNVQENIKLCEKLLGTEFGGEPELDFFLRDGDREFEKAFLRDRGIRENDVVIGFHPGGSTLKNHENKRWDARKFSELGSILVRELNAKVLVFGGPDEDSLKLSVVGAIDSAAALKVDTPNLALTAAVMRCCSVFVSNDSSLMHVASALKLNVVLICGPMNPQYTYPWKTEHRIVSLHLECSPCFFYSPHPLVCRRTDVKFKCLRELEVGLVHQAVSELLEKSRAAKTLVE